MTSLPLGHQRPESWALGFCQRRTIAETTTCELNVAHFIYFFLNSRAWECPRRGWDHLSGLWAARSAGLLIPHYVMLERESVWILLTKCAGVWSQGEAACSMWYLLTQEHARLWILPTVIEHPLVAYDFQSKDKLARSLTYSFTSWISILSVHILTATNTGAGDVEVNKTHVADIFLQEMVN